jgi:hypothetical protein
VCPDEHLAQLDEIAMLLIVHFNDAPWVSTTAHLAAISSGHLSVGTDNRERHLGHDFVVLSNSLVIIKLVSWAFEDLNVVIGDVIEDLDFISTNRCN